MENKEDVYGRELLKSIEILKIGLTYYIDRTHKLEEENKELKEMLKNRIEYTNKLEEDLFQNASNYVIAKSKLKAKIEEVEQWELYNMKIPKLSTLDERLGAKIGIKYVLQSLLGKE